MERFEIARLFGHDPSNLQRLPASEFRKRRDYMLAVKGIKNDSKGRNVTVEATGDKLEENATIIE